MACAMTDLTLNSGTTPTTTTIATAILLPKKEINKYVFSFFEFESLVTLINSKIEWFDLEEIRALLLAHEQRLDKARITEEAASLNFTQSQPNSKTPNSVNPNSATETQIAPQANWTTRNSNSGNYDSQNKVVQNSKE